MISPGKLSCQLLMMSAELSVDPSSTMMSFRLDRSIVWVVMLTKKSSKYFSQLYTAETTL